MKKTRKIVMGILGVLTIFCLGLIIFGTHSPKSEKKSSNPQIKIVTTTDTYSDIAQQIVGNAGQAQAIINNPHLDPHDFKPTNKTTEQITNADLVISNGLGYDSWVEPMISKQKWLNLGRDVAHLKTGANPHLWFNYQIIVQYTNQLAKILGQIMPAKKDSFKANARNYQKNLMPIKKKINQLQAPQNYNLVDVSEPLFNYALTDLGYKVNNASFSLAIENETDPGIKDAQTTIADFKEHRVAFYVQNLQAENNTTKTLLKAAKEFQIPILYLTEMKPAGLTYIEWQLQIYDKLAKILKKSI